MPQIVESIEIPQQDIFTLRLRACAVNGRDMGTLICHGLGACWTVGLEFPSKGQVASPHVAHRDYPALRVTGSFRKLGAL